MTATEAEHVRLLLQCAKMETSARLAVEVATLACEALANIATDAEGFNPKDFAGFAGEGLAIVARIKRELGE